MSPSDLVPIVVEHHIIYFHNLQLSGAPLSNLFGVFPCTKSYAQGTLFPSYTPDSTLDSGSNLPQRH
jgi:hypothetical protein